MPLLEAGLDVLVEKPLAASLAEADDLVSVAARHQRILQPGHLERFNPAVLAVEPKLRRPMFLKRTGSQSSRRAPSMWMSCST